MSLSELDPLRWMTQSRPYVAAILLGVLWTAESLVPMFAGRRHRFAHYATNLGLALLNAGITSLLAFILLAVVAWANTHAFGLLRLVALPVWLNWIGAIVLLDCWQYWWHRINHRVPLLWRFHAVHHSIQAMDWLAAYRVHPLEQVLTKGLPFAAPIT